MASKERRSKNEKKQRKSLIDLITYAYIRRIKKWMFCPACQDGKMSINRSSTLWQCESCGYQLSADEFEDDYVFWFCDECEAYLNSQEEFNRNSPKHICKKCGYENDTTFDTIKGICTDCGKTIPDPDSTLCVDCRLIRREKAKKWLLVAGAIASAVLAAVAVSNSTSTSTGTAPIDITDIDDSDDADEVYGLGPGLYPTCKTCGAKMTSFDNWAWYTCPACSDSVRIIEGKETWYDEVFGTGKKTALF